MLVRVATLVRKTATPIIRPARKKKPFLCGGERTRPSRRSRNRRTELAVLGEELGKERSLTGGTGPGAGPRWTDGLRPGASNGKRASPRRNPCPFRKNVSSAGQSPGNSLHIGRGRWTIRLVPRINDAIRLDH